MSNEQRISTAAALLDLERKARLTMDPWDREVFRVAVSCVADRRFEELVKESRRRPEAVQERQMVRV